MALDPDFSPAEKLATGSVDSRRFHDFLEKTGLFSAIGSEDSTEEVLSIVSLDKASFSIFGTLEYTFAPLDTIKVSDPTSAKEKRDVFFARKGRKVVPLFKSQLESGGIRFHRSVFTTKSFAQSPPAAATQFGSKAIRMAKIWLADMERVLTHQGIEPTPAKVIQLWGYQGRTSYLRPTPAINGIVPVLTKTSTPEALALIDIRIFDLIRNDVPPNLGLQSLSALANPELAEGKFAYSVEFITSLSGVPSSYTERLFLTQE